MERYPLMRLSRPFIAAAICLAMPHSGRPPLAAVESTVDESPISDNDRQHWSFRPLQQSPVKSGRAGLAATNSVDTFVNARLKQHELEPLPRASRVTWLRRVTLDLCGLPPRPDEIDGFVSDFKPDAYQRVVDRLLASPHYGERWGQHWLDLARFAETDGFEHDKIRPDAWKFRDWVIHALNQNMSYEQFVTRQLAGDRLSISGEDTSIATAFCLSGPDMPDINSQDERRHNLLNEMTTTVGSALLGLQFGCAQCHDHKYDPISQADFYRMRAIFQPAVHVVKNRSVGTFMPSKSKAERSFLMIRGEWTQPGPELMPAYPRIANPQGDRLVKDKDAGHHRLAFARWLMRSDHPLTARVIVNRIWQHHFGQGLSRTPSDFGVLGDPPSHPLLLDHLAQQLMRHDWNLKWLHRQIVLSETYRRASRSIQPVMASEVTSSVADAISRARGRDPDNRWLARFPRRRLDAEVIRDCMLAAADLLNTKQGGPGVMPPLAKELASTLLKNQWKTTENLADHHRRSIYIFARRNLRYPILDVFDRPEANASCAVRGRSTTASQSLFMLNSEFSYYVSGELATLLAGGQREVGQDWLGHAFRRILCRYPSPTERDDFDRILGLSNGEFSAAQSVDLERMVDTCLALFNSSEFVYVD